MPRFLAMSTGYHELLALARFFLTSSREHDNLMIAMENDSGRMVRIPRTATRRSAVTFAKMLGRVAPSAVNGFEFEGRFVRPGSEIAESDLPARAVLLEGAGSDGSGKKNLAVPVRALGVRPESGRVAGAGAGLGRELGMGAGVGADSAAGARASARGAGSAASGRAPGGAHRARTGALGGAATSAGGRGAARSIRGAHGGVGGGSVTRSAAESRARVENPPHGARVFWR